MYYSILAGRNAEHNLVGNVAAYGIQRSIARSLTDAIPAIKRIHVFLEAALGTMAHIAIAIDKTDDAEPRQIIDQAFATKGDLFPISMITKRIVVVDDDIDIEDLSDVEWAIWTRAAAAEKFIVVPGVESWEMERAAKHDDSGAGGKSVRVGIDATMDLEDVEKLVRPIIPGAADQQREDYLGD
jgi:2,5-furandicarboxylate decarboxylase 1